MKQKSIYIGLFIIILFSFCEKPEFNRLSIYDGTDSFDVYLPLPTPSGELINHTYYTISYNETHEQAEWAYYVLKQEYPSGAVNRQNNFRSDPNVTTESASLLDYKYSGFDRGHLVPSGDMTFDLTANSETFFLSNICPQRPELNQRKWRELEEYLREAVMEYGDLYIVTGPIFGNSQETIGGNKVTIPEKFYKAVYYQNQTGSHMLGFIMTNGENTLPLSSYVVSIDEIEEQTNLDFFYQLDDQLETTLEHEIRLADWEGIDD